MQTINVRNMRQKLASLLDEVEAGEEFIIMRHGKAVARLTSVVSEPVEFPDRTELRSSLPPAKESASEASRALRNEERY
ncbi:type II toxin-antitoxin system prevent-host-death family antitoxin [Marinobacter maroccanus]|uniref:Antitoxin n=1 Tax=Marinobacter maroccanus TaxID=2055143 RepID=A0A2S5Z7H4_9GAMM|nr:type II toxin-antitoxin system prevent-host-death family antitoxin [Marinobacter maroccanus]PPI83336.1 type II toxin-antitoxin system prevent-host-death family antitoxin [Marinobacter maroccanus]